MISKTAQLLVDGKVVAIKGIGGFHLAVDAFNDDAVGRLRTRDRGGRMLDTVTTLPDGTELRGLDDLRNYLAGQRRDAFVRHFCRKLLGYALGRGIQLSVEPLLDDMMTKLAADHYRFSIAVESIVGSQQFRSIRASQHDAPATPAGK